MAIPTIILSLERAEKLSNIPREELLAITREFEVADHPVSGVKVGVLLSELAVIAGWSEDAVNELIRDQDPPSYWE